ncbi:MAG TPA: TadG family pilus assembly protein [Candidatus Acidoferrales bacterium]|nr:TadG family pilus assembly protein [Candidatus Acidoferrales bacterium]
MSILRRHSKGQMMVLYAIALPALVGVLALGADMSVMYMNWQALQKAADGAVLAGGGSLPNDTTTQATTDCNAYLTHNGVTGSDTITGPTFGTKVVNNDTITVTVRRNVPYLFANALGLLNTDLQVTATAWAQPVSSPGTGVVPVGLSNLTTMSWGSQVTLFGSDSSTNAPGNFGALDFTNGNPGASGWDATVQAGYNGTVSVGESVPTKPGLMDKKAQDAFNARITAGAASYPSGTWNIHDPSDPRDIVIPVVDWSGANGKSSVPIVGFVHVWLVSVTGNGNGKGSGLSITGMLFREASTVNAGNQPAPPANPTNFQVVLIK